MSRLKKFEWLFVEARCERRPLDNRDLPVAAMMVAAANAPQPILQSWLTKKLEVTYQIVKEHFQSPVNPEPSILAMSSNQTRARRKNLTRGVPSAGPLATETRR